MLLAAASEVNNVDRVAQIELFNNGRFIICIMVHVMSAAHLG